ncbi:ABC transporter substrate-binding protein [Consotaella salsifontis]|uniref:Glutathione transport system substrate-binding protein n=1 Tax=Consotaella salsifontis TaxID=1365950 RepID=A0A1T4SQ40_9HYPH|nr:ABC transporter substrate-binding protein [Consotaella salsifontis]SKA29991.1 glutathione transport system substrate-binding protein [Consotaella salsifontis]
MAVHVKALRGVALLCLAAASVAVPGYAGATTLTILQSEPPRSMDPADQGATFTGNVLMPMYEGLVTRGEDLKLHPGLATKWTVSDDGLTWTFDLREGVKFHDGSDFNAESAAKSFHRLMDEKLGLAGAGRLRPLLKTVEAADPKTLKIELTRNYPAFLDLLASPQAMIVSPSEAEKGDLNRVASGTGPFKFVEWSSGDHVLEEVNPDYWGEKPSVDQLKWTWSAEQSVMNMALQTGDADIVNPLPPVFAASIENNPDLKLVTGNGSAVFWVALNVQQKPLDKVEVRQALNYATDRDALVKALLHGYGTPADSPLAPIPPYHLDGPQPYPYDIDKAKALLEKAGVPDGFTMSVAVQEPEANIAEALQGMWAKIGVKLDIRRLESGVWTKAAFNDPEAKKADNLGSVVASWSSGGFNPDQQLRPLYDTSSWAPSGANLGFYSSKELDDLLDTAASTAEPAKRKELYDQAQKIVNTDAPMVLLYVTKDLVGVKKGVDGVWLIPGGDIRATYATKSSN